MFKTYGEFWVQYCQEHSKPETKRFHLVGTTIMLIGVFGLFVTDQVVMPIGLMMFGFGVNWASHIIYENNNRPISWENPYYSIICGLRMYFLLITRRMVM